MCIPSDLHLLWYKFKILPEGRSARHTGYFAVIETVIFQFFIIRTERFLTDWKKARFLSIVEIIYVLLCPVFSLSIRFRSIAITWINCCLSAVSAVAVLRIKPTIYQHSGSTSLPSQLTSSRLMSCWGDTDSCPGLIYSDRRRVSRRAVLKEQEGTAFPLENGHENDEEGIHDKSYVFFFSLEIVFFA